MQNTRLILFTIFSVSLSLLSGCRSTRQEEIPMPPEPPVTVEENTISAETDVQKEFEALPEGVTLKLKGKVVDYAILSGIENPGKRTVTVFSKASVPYKDVSDVLDRLHEMGFLVDFALQE